jgi:RNA polymerase-binding transcription factor DksA
MAIKKHAAVKPVKNAKSSASGAKKAAPVKKAAPAKKAAPVKNSTSAKAAKGNPKTVAATKKPVAAARPQVKTKAPANKTSSKNVVTKNNSKTVKKTTSNTTVPAKKAAPVKKAAPAPKATAPANKTTGKKEAVTKKAAPVNNKPAAKKAAPVAKAAPAPVAKVEAEVKAPVRKEPRKPTPKKGPTQFVTTNISRSGGKSLPAKPTGRPTPTPAARIAREEKKPNVIIAHRRLDNKSKNGSDESKTMINYQPEFNRSILDEPAHQQGPVYRYSDEELGEFREIITSRLEAARKELIYLQGLITRKDEAGTEDTENRYMNMEDGSGAMEREQLAQLASRQIQFITHLEKAMVRIENKTYGICRVTGKLIEKARLRAVPHATLSIEAKKYMSNKQ